MEEYDRIPLEDAEELSWQEKSLCAETDPEAFFLKRRIDLRGQESLHGL